MAAALLISGISLIAGATLLLDDIPGNDGFGWTFSGLGSLGLAACAAVGGVA